MTPDRFPTSPWERYANRYLLKRCLELGGVCEYEMTDADRSLLLRAKVIPKPKNPEKLRAVLDAKNEIVRQAEKDNANGNRWEDDDFRSVLHNAIDTALELEVSRGT